VLHDCHAEDFNDDVLLVAVEQPGVVGEGKEVAGRGGRRVSFALDFSVPEAVHEGKVRSFLGREGGAAEDREE
jgi:hypothetical protein